MSSEPHDHIRDLQAIEDRYEYEATIETSLAASALATGRRRLSTVAIVLILLAIVAFSAISEIARLGMPVALVVAVCVSLLVSLFFQIDPLVRWSLKRYYSSLFDTNVVAEVRPSGITFLQGGMTTELPWRSISGVKANDKAVVFLKGRGPVAIMPATAFVSAASRDAFISLVRARIPAPA